jgi:DnaJ-class molecular chaperone
MNQAVRCPVCFGTGKVKTRKTIYHKSEENMCHGCYGRGWVEVKD